MEKRKNKLQILRDHDRICPCKKLKKLRDDNRELKSFLKEFLSPKDLDGNILTKGCSSESFDMRFYGFENDLDDNECPFMACRYWIDNKEFDNCSRFASHVSSKDGGWNQRKVAGILGNIRIKIEEEKALRKLKDQMKGVYK